MCSAFSKRPSFFLFAFISQLLYSLWRVWLCDCVMLMLRRVDNHYLGREWNMENRVEDVPPLPTLPSSIVKCKSLVRFAFWSMRSSVVFICYRRNTHTPSWWIGQLAPNCEDLVLRKMLIVNDCTCTLTRAYFCKNEVMRASEALGT